MNDLNIDDDYHDDNAEALERVRDEFEDCKSAVRDHIRVARKTVSDCIDACTSIWLEDGPTGQTFKNFAEQLLEVEHDLSRAEGELG